MLSPAHCSASPCHCTPPFCSFWCSFDERWAECVNAFALTLAELTSPSWRSRARRPAGGVLIPQTGRRPPPSPLCPDPCRHHPHTRHTQSHCDTGLATRPPHPSHRTYIAPAPRHPPPATQLLPSPALPRLRILLHHPGSVRSRTPCSLPTRTSPLDHHRHHHLHCLQVKPEDVSDRAPPPRASPERAPAHSTHACTHACSTHACSARPCDAPLVHIYDLLCAHRGCNHVTSSLCACWVML